VDSAVEALEVYVLAVGLEEVRLAVLARVRMQARVLALALVPSSLDESALDDCDLRVERPSSVPVSQVRFAPDTVGLVSVLSLLFEAAQV